MNLKDESIIEIKRRIYVQRATIGLNKFRYAPTTPIELDDCPACVMIEGIDDIIKRSSRTTPTTNGYTRLAEIIIEVIAEKDANGMPETIKSIFRQVKSAVLENIHPVPEQKQSVFMQEARTEGPMGYGIPNALIMRLVLELMYQD